MSITARVSTFLTAAALAVTATFAAPAGAQTLSDAPVQAEASSQQLPADVAGYLPVAAPAQTEPEPEAPVVAADGVEGRLLTATDQNLTGMGHYADPVAWDIAAQWAGEAMAGQVEFPGGVGRGNSHLDTGDGNIYRLTVDEAEARIGWLDQPVNVTANGTGFGVASARVGDTVYLVEYFLY
jgi:hypothetical protein